MMHLNCIKNNKNEKEIYLDEFWFECEVTLNSVI